MRCEKQAVLKDMPIKLRTTLMSFARCTGVCVCVLVGSAYDRNGSLSEYIELKISQNWSAESGPVCSSLSVLCSCLQDLARSQTFLVQKIHTHHLLSIQATGCTCPYYLRTF